MFLSTYLWLLNLPFYFQHVLLNPWDGFPKKRVHIILFQDWWYFEKPIYCPVTAEPPFSAVQRTRRRYLLCRLVTWANLVSLMSSSGSYLITAHLVVAPTAAVLQHGSRPFLVNISQRSHHSWRPRLHTFRAEMLSNGSNHQLDCILSLCMQWCGKIINFLLNVWFQKGRTNQKTTIKQLSESKNPTDEKLSWKKNGFLLFS